MRNFLFFIILSVVFSCTKKRKNNFNEIDKLITLSQNDTLSIEKKIAFSDKAFVKLKQTDNDSIKRKRCINIANNFFVFYDLEKYHEVSNYLFDLSTKANDSLNLGTANLYIGDYFFEKTVNDSAYYYYKNAEEIYYRLGDNKSLAKVILYKAYILLYEKDFLGSEIATIKALNLSENDPTFKYECYVNLGSAALGLKNYDKALEYHTKSLELIKEIGQSSYKEVFNAQSYNNIGLVFLRQQKYKEAKPFFLNGLKADNLQKKNLLFYTSLLDNLAYSEFKLNEKSSFNNFNKALKLRDSIGNVSGIIKSKLHLAEYYLVKNDISQAKKLNIEAYKAAKEAHFYGEVLQTLELLSKTDVENGLVHAKEYIKLNDSLYNAERETKNKLARIEYETDEIIKEKEILSEQKAIILWISLAVLSIGALLFIILYQRSKQKELVFEQEQQNANQEIYKLMINQQLKIDEVRNTEKNRIAKELHDGIMNKLTSTRLNLFVLSRRRDDETIEKCISHINDIQNIEKEVRSIAHELSNDIFAHKNSFKTILKELIDDQNNLFEAKSHLEIDDQINWEKVDISIKMNLYRVIQEALNNCNKYAKATQIYVKIDADGQGNNTLSIIDNGKGFKTHKIKKGIGIKNMLERAESIGGTFNVKSEINKGTTIVLKFNTFLK